MPSSQLPKRSSAFTLIELLVVIAIIAILAAILFPVFAQAKQAAKKTAAISDMKQGVLASLMYQNDYDDSYVMSDAGCTTNQVGCLGWGFGPPDVVPFEASFPYTKNMDITIDPMDPLQGVLNREQTQFSYIGSPYPATVAQGTVAQQEYAAAVRANLGYNFAFFSPWIEQKQGSNYYVGSVSLNGSQVTQPAHTLMFGTSIWNRSASGTPSGGGNWVVQTPCWLDSNGNKLAPPSNYTNISGAGYAFSYSGGWDAAPLAWDVYGGLWPFYVQTSSTAATGAQNGQVVIGWADGHAKTMPISQTVAGCSAYGTGGAEQGKVTDPTKFIWATEQ